MRVTLKDVAKEAAVSIKTVSRVVNGEGEISESMRRHVLVAIEKLGYRPDRLARSMITGKTHTIGAVIPNVTSPFYAGFVLAAEKIARQRQYNVFLCNSFDNPVFELEYINLLAERRIDGFLLAGSRLEMDDLSRVIDSHKIAILTPFEVPNALVFSLDDYNLGHTVGDYLLSLGHKRIGYLEGSWPIGAHPRYEGLLSAFTAAGHPLQDIVVAEIDPHDREKIGETVQTAMLNLFEKGIDFTALVCYNDAMALQVLQACAEAKVNVPKDLSVVGFDDLPESARTHPALTTVHFDCNDLGAEMMTKLLDLIEGKNEEPRREIFPGYLVVRNSTAAPRNQT